MDYQEKKERFEQISKMHLKEIYKVALYLVNDTKLAEFLTRKAFLELHKNMEYICEELYRTYLIHYVKVQVDGLKNERYKGETDEKEI